MKSSSGSKLGIYLLEGSNCFATSLFFNYLAFRLRDAYGFGNEANLAVGAGYGLVFAVASWFGGRLGQRRGYFTALRWGFGGMAAALVLGLALPTWPGQMVTLGMWTFAMCLTWANLEALISSGEAPRALPGRLGLYNVVWASAAGVAALLGGWLLKRLGPAALFWLPAAIHAAQWCATWPLERRQADSPAHIVLEAPEPASGPAYFRQMAWAANPLAYMAINALLVLSPGLTGRFGWETAAGGAWISLWLHSRAAAFAILWRWPGWHYRFRLFAASYALLALSFCVLVLTRSVAVFIVAQIVFGWAVALLYHSSLYYAMDGSSAQGEHGGIHEALVGLGNFAGPALCAGGYAIAGHEAGSAWAMGGALAAGAVIIGRLRARGVRAEQTRREIVAAACAPADGVAHSMAR